MHCPNCQHEITENDEVCPNCGFDLRSSDVTRVDRAVTAPQPPGLADPTDSEITRLDGGAIPLIDLPVEDVIPPDEITNSDATAAVLPALEAIGNTETKITANSHGLYDDLDQETVHLVGARSLSPAGEVEGDDANGTGLEHVQEEDFDSLLKEFPPVMHHEEPGVEVSKPERPKGRLSQYLRQKWKLLLLTLLLLAGIVAVIFYLSSSLGLIAPSKNASAADKVLIINPRSRLALGQARLTGTPVGVSRDGVYLAALDGLSVSLENVVTGERSGPYVMEAAVTALALSPKGDTLAIIQENDTLLLMDVRAGREIAEFTEFKLASPLLNFSPSEPLLALGSESGQVAVIDAPTGALLYQERFNDPVVAVSLIDQQPLLALAFADGQILVIDHQQDTILTRINSGMQPTQLALSPSGLQLAVIQAELISLFQVDTAARSWATGAMPGMQCILINESTLVCATPTHLGAWNAANGSLAQWFPLNQALIAGMRFNAPSDELALLTQSRQVLIYAFQPAGAQVQSETDLVTFPMSPIRSDVNVSLPTPPAALSTAGSADSAWELALNPLDQAQLVRVPGGQYAIFSPGEKKVARVTLSSVYLADYDIYQHEVTSGQYQLCVDAGICTPPDPPSYPSGEVSSSFYPVVGVTWFQSMQYCTWAGGKLPTNEQWDAAARNADLSFPWGSKLDDTRANFCDQSCQGGTLKFDDGYAFLSPVGVFPGGASAFGVLDMLGNAAEWTGSSALGTLLKSSSNAVVQSDKYQVVVRGGSWNTQDAKLDVNTYQGVSPYTFNAEIGFRCVIERLP